MMYLPGITFLFIASAVVAIPFTLLVKNKSLAVLISVCASTLILKLWAYLSIGGFDLGFLMVLIIIGICAAASVQFAMERIRNQFVGE